MAEPKQRHGCLLAFLILLVVVNSTIAGVYLLGSHIIQQSVPQAPLWTIITLGLVSVLNVIFAIAIFNWKKWGFWGFIMTSLIALYVNLTIGIGIGNSLVGLLGVAILYGVLQIGKQNKGWKQLE